MWVGLLCPAFGGGEEPPVNRRAPSAIRTEYARVTAQLAALAQEQPRAVRFGEETPEVLALYERAWKSIGDNAVLKMFQLAPAIEAIDFPGWEPHPVVKSPPVASVNVIQGGFKVNVVPDRCSITVDFRYPPGMTHETIIGRGTQKSVIDKMQTREELYAVLGYHDYERKLDELFADRRRKGDK